MFSSISSKFCPQAIDKLRLINDSTIWVSHELLQFIAKGYCPVTSHRLWSPSFATESTNLPYVGAVLGLILSYDWLKPFLKMSEILTLGRRICAQLDMNKLYSPSGFNFEKLHPW